MTCQKMANDISTPQQCCAPSLVASAVTSVAVSEVPWVVALVSVKPYELEVKVFE
jgi:hypothetical protein